MDPTWTLTIHNTRHTVRLQRNIAGGIQEVWVDGARISHESKLFSWESNQSLCVDGEEYTLVTITSYRHFLLHQGLPVVSDKEKQAGKTAEDLLQTRHFRDQNLCLDLARLLNVGYYPNYTAGWAFRHRLVGQVNGYLLLIQFGRLRDSARQGWFLEVRHSTPFSPMTGSQLRKDSRVAGLLGNLKRWDLTVSLNPDATGIFLPYKKNETAPELAGRVRAFLAIIPEYARPLPEVACENPECRAPLAKDLQLVLVNGLPRLYCQDCIIAIPAWGEKARDAYRQTPIYLFPGLIVGIGVAILGAVLWAAFALLFDRITAVVGLLILATMIRMMDKVGTKRGWVSLLTAVLLTFAGVTLGSLAAIFLTLIRLGSPLAWQTILAAVRGLAGSRILFLSYSFTLIGAVFYLFPYWMAQRDFFSRTFKPQVELLPEVIWGKGLRG